MSSKPRIFQVTEIPTKKKRKDPVVDQVISPLPNKRARTVPRRLGQCESSNRKLRRNYDPCNNVYMPFGSVKPSIEKKFLEKLKTYNQK